MTGKSDNPPPATGRTVWDFFAEVVRTLGIAAPYLLVAAGVVFAFVEIEKAGSRAREQSAAALEAAHKEVRNTYTAIGGMSQRMIANVQALLDLQDNLQARIQEAQTLHQTVTRQIKDVETQRDQLTSDLSTHRAQLRQTRKELSETQGERDKARSEQSKRLDEYHRLRQELAQLADKVLDQREEALDTETLRAEIARIDREYISDPSAWLRAFAKDPGEATGRTLTRLEGLRYDALETAIRSTAGDFRIWIKATIGDTMNFLGVVKRDRDIYRQILFLYSDTPGIIDNVEVSPFLVGVLARPPHDWMTLTRAIMGPDIDLEPTPGEFWSIRNFLKTALAEDADPIPGVTVEFLSGDDEELPFLSVADLKIRYPSVLDQWAELDPTIAEYVELLRRANTIASGEVPSRYPLPASIKQAFGALLSNIAKGEAQSAAEYLAGEIREQEDLLNRIAEVILAPGFRAVGARAEDATSPIAQQAMLMPDLPTSSAAESPVPTLPSRFEIITSYEDPLVKDERRHASFLFARVGDPLAWRLINFISDTGGPSVPLESGSRALRDW